MLRAQDFCRPDEPSARIWTMDKKECSIPAACAHEMSMALSRVLDVDVKELQAYVSMWRTFHEKYSNVANTNRSFDETLMMVWDEPPVSRLIHTMEEYVLVRRILVIAVRVGALEFRKWLADMAVVFVYESLMPKYDTPEQFHLACQNLFMCSSTLSSSSSSSSSSY